MPILFGDHINLDQKQIQNAILHPVVSDGSPADGQIWYRSDLGEFRIRIGGVTKTLSFTGHAHAHTDITDFDTGVRENRLDQMAAPTAAVNLNNQKITTLADPTADQDAANKRYVDGVAQGVRWTTARVATTANITLSGTQTIDTIGVIAGDRVLVKNQGTPAQNGVYVVAAGAWSRAADMDTAAEVDGKSVIIEDGTQAGTLWITVSEVTTLGTDSIVFTQFGNAADLIAGAGLTRSGNTFAVENGGITEAHLTGIARRRDAFGGARVMMTTNVNTAAPGATLDGVSISGGDRVLLVGQTTATEDGIWIWNGAAIPMTRDPDLEVGDYLMPGTIIPIRSGTYARTIQALTPTGSGWVPSPLDIPITGGISATVVSPSAVGKYAETLATSATSYVVTHNLNTQDVTVSVRDTSNQASVITSWEATSVNVVTVYFSTAPTANTRRVVVMG